MYEMTRAETSRRNDALDLMSLAFGGSSPVSRRGEGLRLRGGQIRACDVHPIVPPPRMSHGD